jgi:hypothetical protein
VLGLYRHADIAARLLTSAGITRELFESVLDDEPGPSPLGAIPYTPRAMMIVCLAATAADSLGTLVVNEVHLLLGVIAESRRWDLQHAWGPHHLKAAAETVGTSLDALEHAARRALPA